MQYNKAFLQLVQQPEADINLARAALLISQAFQADLDVEHWTQQLEDFAHSAGHANVHNGETLLEFLHQQQNFCGNPKDYYSLDNSLLDKVMASRSGIPITLAVIYIEVGRQLSLPVYGISFPGHFLVGVQQSDDNPECLIDTFGGKIVHRDDCYRLIKRLYKREVAPDNRYFEAAGARRILLRILENIKGIFVRQGNADKALVSLDYQLMIEPDSDALLKQQQQLLAHFGKHQDKGPSVH